MQVASDFPEDFQECVRFHGHVCPGLAIGYAAARAARTALMTGHAEDEELVAVVENDSCAVDAVQVLLGCTFGKGNLIFRDWGKQVFTFFDRKTHRGLRISFTGAMPAREERHRLKVKIDAGAATEGEKLRFEELKELAVKALISADPEKFFQIREVKSAMPPPARIVTTRECDSCGELTMTSKLKEKDGRMVCGECFL